jgi:nucleotide-binding universal stress UspA family protein
MRKIVVGTDGSDNAMRATRWAAEEAELHGADLEAMLVWSYVDQYHADRSDTFDTDYTEETARDALSSWVVSELGADAAVGLRVVFDLPLRALLEAGDDADLLVLGARGRGGFEGLLLGSVSDRVAQAATRPVAVVREQAPVRRGLVVVGVDGSARSFSALRWAAAEARARDADLDVVHAEPMPMMRVPPAVSMARGSLLDQAKTSVLETAAADPALADTRAHLHATPEPPARALMQRAADAGLLVVGARGLGRIVGTLLGSVSRQLLHHSPCPLVII